MIPELLTILAQGEKAAAPGGLFGNPIVLMLLMFGLMYFVLIRPQSQERKRLAAMIEAVKTGDKVITSSGIHGTITSVKEKSVMIKIADNTKVEFEKAAIAAVVQKESKASASSDNS